MDINQLKAGLDRGALSQLQFEKLAASLPPQPSAPTALDPALQAQPVSLTLPTGEVTVPFGAETQDIPIPFQSAADAGAPDVNSSQMPTAGDNLLNSLGLPAAPAAPATNDELAYNAGLQTKPGVVTESAIAAFNAGKEKANVKFADAAGLQTQLTKLDTEYATQRKVEEEAAEAQKARAQTIFDEAVDPANALDPGRVFKNAGTWGTIGLILANGIVKATLNENLLEKIIERDIATQKEGIANRQLAGKSQITLYDKMLEKLKEKKLAHIATRAGMFEMAKLKLLEMSQETKDMVAGNTMRMQAAALDLKVKIEEDKFKERVIANKIAGISDQNSAKLLGVPLDQIQATQGGGDARIIKPGEKDELTISQKILQFRKEDRKALNEANEKYVSTRSAFTGLDDLFTRSKGINLVTASVPYSPTPTLLRTFHARIESLIRSTMKGEGVIQEAEVIRQIEPFKPQPGDTLEQLKVKQQEIKMLLEQRAAGSIAILKELKLLPTELKHNKATKEKPY